MSKSQEFIFGAWNGKTVGGTDVGLGKGQVPQGLSFKLKTSNKHLKFSLKFEMLIGILSKNVKQVRERLRSGNFWDGDIYI